jgi:hypothetical protein
MMIIQIARHHVCLDETAGVTAGVATEVNSIIVPRLRTTYAPGWWLVGDCAATVGGRVGRTDGHEPREEGWINM